MPNYSDLQPFSIISFMFNFTSFSSSFSSSFLKLWLILHVNYVKLICMKKQPKLYFAHHLNEFSYPLNTSSRCVKENKAALKR